MIKTLARRVALSTLATVAAVGVSTLFATAASAHTAGVTGVANCDTKGGWTITWTVSNDYKTTGTIETATLDPADPNAKIPASVDPNSSVTFTSTVTASDVKSKSVPTTATLTVTLKWPDNYKNTGSKTVPLNGPCASPSPSAPPTESTPTPSPSASRPPVVTPTPSASVPSLPVTGSNTTYPMVGAGVGLVAAGGVLLFVIRRRRRVTFSAE